MIRGDRGRIRQVLHTLVSNAMRQKEAGDTIDLIARADEAGIVLTVTDTGAPIQFEDQPTIFSDIGGSDRRNSAGSVLVDRIVEMHGGWPSLESDPETGITTVSIHLPYEPKLDHAEPTLLQ